jgi:hypothetical protein
VSEHPDRDALVAEAVTHARDLARRAAAGEQVMVYRTSKGEPRLLEVLTTEEVLARAAGSADMIRYCYVEHLDFGLAEGPLPDKIQLDRCIVGRISARDLDFGRLIFKGIVLGDADLGKTWEAERNRSKTFPPSRFDDLVFRETVFLGRANFWGVAVGPGRAYFPMAVFEGEADFKGAEFAGVTEFRFASFGAGANFKGLRMHAPVYFGGSRYRADTVFTSMYSERDVYFNSTVFEAGVSFDHNELERGATFEDARFAGPATFATTEVAETLNLSRAEFHDVVNVREVELGALDAFGARFYADAYFQDASITGKTRFALDASTRRDRGDDPAALVALYRRYQGDEDADEPLVRGASYGVAGPDDLTSRIDGNLSFANTVFGGYTVFEGVSFGTAEKPGLASFYNAQFLGETHFEHTRWHAQADFSTIFANELAFNLAVFERSLVLDDASVAGRVTLTGAGFGEGADLSFYGAEIASFQVVPEQIDTGRWTHRLFYEGCAEGRIPREDLRIDRMLRDGPLSDDALAARCRSAAIDEFVALKDSYGGRAMAGAADDAYWWVRHHQALRDVWHGSWPRSFRAVVLDLALFELCFGWGVRLGNLGVAVLALTVIYACLYRFLCPDTILQYDGEDVAIRDVPFFGLLYVSLQSMIAVNTGWDFGDDDHRFRVLNTTQMLSGVILVTFFVGAYTRMILA